MAKKSKPKFPDDEFHEAFRVVLHDYYSKQPLEFWMEITKISKKEEEDYPLARKAAKIQRSNLYKALK